MKPRTSYKYMDTRMLIRLAMFQIKDQPVVSCFFFRSGVVSWSNKKQPIVTLSNMKAKYKS
jgi:hypothetical protein